VKVNCLLLEILLFFDDRVEKVGAINQSSLRISFGVLKGNEPLPD